MDCVQWFFSCFGGLRQDKTLVETATPFNKCGVSLEEATYCAKIASLTYMGRNNFEINFRTCMDLEVDEFNTSVTDWTLTDLGKLQKDKQKFAQWKKSEERFRVCSVVAEQTALFIIYDRERNKLYVSVRPTGTLDNWKQNMRLRPSVVCGQRYCTHVGFLDHAKALEKEFFNLLKSILLESKCSDPPTITFTGMSLGGAVVQLLALWLKVKRPSWNARVRIITFGAPRVGDERFQLTMNSVIGKNNIVQFCNRLDVVPECFRFTGFVHAGVRVVTPEEGVDLEDSVYEIVRPTNSLLTLFHHATYFGVNFYGVSMVDPVGK